MKKTLVAGAVIALGAMAPVVPHEPQNLTVQKAKTHLKYLKERHVYIQAHKDELNIPDRVVNNTNPSVAKYRETIQKRGLEIDQFDKITKGKQSVFSAVKNSDIVKKAEAYTFGKEDFEDCVSLPCTFTTDASYGTGGFALDATSKVNGTDSADCDIQADDDGCVLRKTVTAGDEYYAQFYIFIPTGWSFGASSYAGLFTFSDGTGNPVNLNIEDYGSIRITAAGDELGYTDTGIDLSLNTLHKLEIRAKINSSTGDVDIWLDNDTEGSPDYDGSGSLNTGSDDIDRIEIGGYHPDNVDSKYYDDVIFDTSFIGSGVTPTTPITTDEVIWFN